VGDKWGNAVTCGVLKSRIVKCKAVKGKNAKILPKIYLKVVKTTKFIKNTSGWVILNNKTLKFMTLICILSAKFGSRKDIRP
jgi:hypothetical protein